ncbi:multicopper oxidase family protein [Limibaculum sp. M0105]|uniref:Multicopper oxidase family protein n=1 Tax=Thermohalobaculum xanthum TaxID=2753746 RepID=A0A8J7SCW4_9RHOB|nr:multicopper oxidase family protein [Thermohalobaculum xanthum]MBK0398878.1 multicopper oxidase family protein [Thermohalobaculum xanthum]
MPIGRRAFLAGLGAGATAQLWPACGALASPGAITLTAAPGTAQIAPRDMNPTGVWHYDGQTPGPVLRVPQGARVRALLRNALPDPTTIHWHGIRIANAMDGVPGMTQAPVEPGGEFLYDFVVPDAGTYWYHPHRQSWEQQARGLAGALIVEEPAPPPVDRDLPVLLQDWRLGPDGAFDEASLGSMHDFSHAGRLGNWTTVNGDGDATWPVRRNERLRLRLINAATARVYTLALKGLDGWVVAHDGMPVPPSPVPDRLTLAPAQRTDLIVDVSAAEGTEAVLAVIDRQGAYAAVLMPVDGLARPGPEPAPAPIARNPAPMPGALDGAAQVELKMEGGAMSGLASARMSGREMGIRELVEHGMAWAMNGVAGMPDAPLLTLERGRTARIRLVNYTGWPHAMHLHGHHFQVVHDGRPDGPLRDTLLIQPRETGEIAFVADNPGDWMLHCHMAEHMASGMMSWVRVA